MIQDFEEKFQKIRIYGENGELSDAEAEKLGLGTNQYKTLDECGYQCAYDLSNDWIKETPDWDDVEKAYKLGAKEALKWAMEHLTH